MHYRPLDTLYLTGLGEVIIAAKNNGDQVFKRASRGGENGGNISRIIEYFGDTYETIIGEITNVEEDI